MSPIELIREIHALKHKKIMLLFSAIGKSLSFILVTIPMFIIYQLTGLDGWVNQFLFAFITFLLAIGLGFYVLGAFIVVFKNKILDSL